MRMDKRVFFATIYFVYCCCICNSENNLRKERKEKYLFSLFGYIHGYRIGQKYRSPTILISPLVIVPTVNKHQSVTINGFEGKEKYQENGDVLQVIRPTKFVINSDENDTRKIEDSKISDNLRQATVFNETLAKENYTTNISYTSESASEITSTVTVSEASTQKGIYPTPVYNNKNITTLVITTEKTAPADLFGLPPIADNRWQNFSSNFKNTNSVNEKRTTTKTYLAAKYNGNYDKVSFTTTPYEEKSTEDTRQQNTWYVSKVPQTSEFKPLAGLYYDGFLHTPLKMLDFHVN